MGGRVAVRCVAVPAHSKAHRAEASTACGARQRIAAVIVIEANPTAGAAQVEIFRNVVANYPHTIRQRQRPSSLSFCLSLGCSLLLQPHSPRNVKVGTPQRHAVREQRGRVKVVVHSFDGPHSFAALFGAGNCALRRMQEPRLEVHANKVGQTADAHGVTPHCAAADRGSFRHVFHADWAGHERGSSYICQRSQCPQFSGYRSHARWAPARQTVDAL
jgi:hypothetical protein